MASAVTEVAAFVWAALATVGAFGAAFVRWRSSVDETTTAVWREEAEAYKAKAERLEVLIRDLARRVSHLEAENTTLRALHDSRAEVLSLREAVMPALAEIAARLHTMTTKGE